MEATTLLNWFEEPIKQSISSLFGDINRGVEALDLFNIYKNSQLRLIDDLVSHVKILGMDKPAMLADIYTPATVSTTIHSRLYSKDWISTDTLPIKKVIQAHKKVNLVPGDKFVEDNLRTVVLGGPGSGKTTFLKHLALSYSNKEIFIGSNLKTTKLPFFVSLPFLCKTDQGIFDYIAASLIRKTDEYANAFCERVLNNGLGIVLLDSLDEVPADKRSKVIDRIKSFTTCFPKCKIVLSCRTADYEVVLENFCEVEIARLSITSVNKIIRAWFKYDQKKAEKLIKLIKSDDGVSCLTETPLLLSLLCIQYRHDLTLPKRKTEVYRRCVDALLRDWDTSRGFRRDTVYSTLSDDRKERIFEYVAGKFIEPTISYVFPEQDLTDSIGHCCKRFGLRDDDSQGILDEIERHHGIFEQL